MEICNGYMEGIMILSKEAIINGFIELKKHYSSIMYFCRTTMILEANRQEELNTLLDKLAKHKPTKILLESPRIQMDSIINNQYQNYLKGTFKNDDKQNEIYQIGFRLAKKLSHQRVQC